MQEKKVKDSKIIERISEMIDFLHLKPNSFAKKLGYPRAQTIYDILNGKSLPSYDFFKRLLNTEYSEIINLEWLIIGKGEMEKKKESKETIVTDSNALDKIIELASENALLKKELKALRGGNYQNMVAEP